MRCRGPFHLSLLLGAKDPRLFATATSVLLETDLPRLEIELREAHEVAAAQAAQPATSPPGPADRASHESLAAWFRRSQGVTVPPGELRATWIFGANGAQLSQKTPPYVPQAIGAGRQKFTVIKGPVLAIHALPHDPGPPFADDKQRAEYEAFDVRQIEPQVQAFGRGVPQARVVCIPRANHLVYLSNEGQVLREMRRFIDGLSR